MSVEQEVNTSSTIIVRWLTLGEAQRLLNDCYRPGFRSEPCTELRVANDRGHRKTVKDEGTKRNCIQIMMRTCTMLAGTMRNHIEITAGKSTRPRRTRSRNPVSSYVSLMTEHRGRGVYFYGYDWKHEFESIAAWIAAWIWIDWEEGQCHG